MNGRFYISLLLLVFSPLLYAAPFAQTLTGLQEYAAAMPEYPDIDNNNWTKPDYTSFYLKHIPSFWQRMSLSSKPFFDIKEFKKSLEEVTLDRENNGYMDDYSLALKPHKKNRFVIWGDLQGAFHSLVRDLAWLKEQQIVNEELGIIKPEYYFVFNGNVVDGSPYILETLHVVLHLMKVNPNRIIYIRGKHETKEAWHNYGLRRELELRARNGSPSGQIPLGDIMNRFFFTLPKTLYLIENIKPDTVDVARISQEDIDFSLLASRHYPAPFEALPPDTLTIMKQSAKEEESNKSLTITAFIKSENRSLSFHPTHGLVLLESEQNATTWSILSSPTGSNRRLYDFFYDAFTVLTTDPCSDNWTLTLYNRDVRDPGDFKNQPAMSLNSGALAGTKPVTCTPQDTAAASPAKIPAVKETPNKKDQDIILSFAKGTPQQQPAVFQPGQEITVGTTMDLSKSAKIYGERMKQGVYLALDAQNKRGGIGGKKIEFVVLDDGYNPERARANVLKLLSEFKTPFLLAPEGTPTISAYLDLIRKKEVMALFPAAGAQMLHKEVLEYAIFFRAAYQRETEILVDYAVHQLGASKIAAVYQNDLFGKEGLAGARAALQKFGLNNIVEIPFNRNDLNFANQIKIVKDEKPDTVLFICTSISAMAFIRQIGVSEIASKQILGVSDLCSQSFLEFARDKGLQTTLSSIVPNPAKSTLPIAQEFRELAKKYNTPIDTPVFEGFIDAKLMIDIFSKVEGPITLELVFNVIKNINKYNFEGLELQYQYGDPSLSHIVWLNTGGDEWLAQQTWSSKRYDDAIPQAAAVVAPEQVAPIATPSPKASAQQIKKPMPPTADNVTNIGVLLDVSKSIQEQSKPFVNGFKLFFKYNKPPDIAFEVTTLNEEYHATLNKRNVENLINNFDIDIILGPIGTKVLQTYLDLVRQKKILVLFPVSGAKMFRAADLEYLIHLRTSYYNEGKVLALYLLKELQAKNIALVYQNDEFGKELLEGALSVLKGTKATYTAIEHAPSNINLNHQIAHIERLSPDAICFFSNVFATEEIINNIGVRKLANTSLLGTSNLLETSFSSFLENIGLHMIRVSTFPDPKTSDTQIAQEFRAMATKDGVQLDIFSFEGYLYASLFADITKHITKPITKEKIIDRLTSLHDYNFKGLKLTFDPKVHSLIHYLWLDKDDGTAWSKMEIPAEN